ncbi:MAG: ammonium transporter [Phycisphaeraceae bacterium]|nr:ammonium transporter [Phycisphaeraceae bacterium]
MRNGFRLLWMAGLALAIGLFAASAKADSGAGGAAAALHHAATLVTQTVAQSQLAADEVADPLAELKTQAGDIKIAVDTMWVLLTAFLVFFMNLGFGMVESGLCRAKNTVNILTKNFIVFAISTLGFWVIGWGLMFGNGNGFFGTDGLFFVSGADNSPATGDAYQGVYTAINWTGVPLWAKFFFQLVFCGTAATIVSGAVAERIKFNSFLVFSFLLTGITYAVVGHMIWGGGLLAGKGMFDFAGSTVVHSVGGWAALAGVLVLGPRMGKYGKDGSVNPIPGHNMTSVMAGGLVLWFGWFGFNPGSTMGAVGYADAIAHIAVTTNTAAAVATVAAAVTSWLLQGKPDFTMIVNGTLAGLVAITAPCAFVSVPSSAFIGLIAGVIVVFAVIMFDKLRVDDPVGALSVHLVNGVFGTICVGLFADTTVNSAAQGAVPLGLRNGLFTGGGTGQLISQLIGVVVAGAIAFGSSIVFWLIIKTTMGLRVSDVEQIEGLDLGEHDQAAYPDFQITNIKSYHIREA